MFNCLYYAAEKTEEFYLQKQICIQYENIE